MKRNRIITALLLVLLILTTETGCSSDHVPDNGHDIVSMAYTNMKSPDSYSVNTDLVLTIQFTKKAVQTKLHSQIAAYKEPFEVITKSVGSILGEKETTTYTYMYENGDKTYLCSYNQGKWEKHEVQEEEKAVSPVDFGAFFIDIDSFEIVKKEENAVIIEGRVMKENIENALKDSGALRQFMLPSLPADKGEGIADVIVRAWVDQESLTITKAEIDMKEAMQGVLNTLLGKDSQVVPEIKECRFIIDQIKLNTVEVIGLPKEVKEGLEAIKS